MTTMKRANLVFLRLAAILLLVGCSSSRLPAPRTVVSASEGLPDLWHGRVPSPAEAAAAFPMRIDFKRGERVPVRLFLGGSVLETPKDSPPADLIVRRDFSMLFFRDRPPLFSFDGVRWRGLRAWKGGVLLGVGAKPGASELSLGMLLEPRK